MKNEKNHKNNSHSKIKFYFFSTMDIKNFIKGGGAMGGLNFFLTYYYII